MNAIVEFEVNEVTVDNTAAQSAPAIVEIDVLDLNMVGGGLVSPCFA